MQAPTRLQFNFVMNSPIKSLTSIYPEFEPQDKICYEI